MVSTINLAMDVVAQHEAGLRLRSALIDFAQPSLISLSLPCSSGLDFDVAQPTSGVETNELDFDVAQPTSGVETHLQESRSAGEN
jgi:hypothetical protein